MDPVTRRTRSLAAGSPRHPFVEHGPADTSAARGRRLIVPRRLGESVAEVEGARTFGVAGATYDSFMGRYSRPLAEQLADAASVVAGHTAIDVGCGPGALTGELVARLGAPSVFACDPSPPFCEECAARFPGVVVKQGRAEAIPFENGIADHALAQLVLHFVSEPEVAAREMARVVRPGGTVAACVWDFDDGMEMLRAFWDAALSLDPDAPDEARVLRFGRTGEIAELFSSAQLEHIEESTLRVESTYESFDELWDGFLAGVGPAGSYCVSLGEPERARLRDALVERLGSPSGSFTLGAVARCAVARVPG
jgi:ubiquinone/menaquinone biosynthesis C-methylase UbiE